MLPEEVASWLLVLPPPLGSRMVGFAHGVHGTAVARTRYGRREEEGGQESRAGAGKKCGERGWNMQVRHTRTAPSDDGDRFLRVSVVLQNFIIP